MIRSVGLPYLLIALFWVAACGSPTPSESLPSVTSTEKLNQIQKEKFEKAEKPAFVQWGELAENSAQFDFQCEDCPPSFGLFVSTTVDGKKTKPARITANCQGGLIGEDLFITSQHCIPKDLLEKDKSCKHRVQILFPKTKDENDISLAECDSIIEFSTIYPQLKEEDPQPDWAIIKLATKYPERYQTFKSQGIPDATPIKAFIPLKKNDSKKISLTEVSCSSRQKSLALPEYNSDESPIALFDCDRDITKGFSGSLLFHVTDEGLFPLALLSHIWDQQINGEKILVSRHVVASSLNCIIGETPLSESCQFDPNNRKKIKEKLVIAEIESVKEKMAEEFAKIVDSDHLLEWEEVTVKKAKSGKTTKQISNYWQQIKSLKNGFMHKAGKAAYFEALVQKFPKCIKKDSIPDPNDPTPVLIDLPLVTLNISRDKSRRVKVEHATIPIRVRVMPDRSDLKLYTFELTSALAPASPPKNPIMSGRFNHAAASVPICP